MRKSKGGKAKAGAGKKSPVIDALIVFREIEKKRA